MCSSETLLANNGSIVTASTMFHQTSDTGKGGVSALLKFAANGQMAATTFSVICAHLDSKSKVERTRGLMQILEENARQKQFNSTERKRPARPSCEIWDADSDYCKRQRGKEYKAVDKEPIDAVLLFGDLNYRLSNDTDPSKDLAELISTPGGRDIMSHHDTLLSSLLVKDQEQGGLAFKCNQPYQFLPSYKRNKEKIEACASITQATTQRAEELARECFTDKNGTWKQRNGHFQLGWLDRFCFRSVSHSSVSLSFTNQTSWDEYQNYSTRSDHTPQEVVVKIAHPTEEVVVKIVPWCRVPNFPADAQVYSYLPDEDSNSSDSSDLQAGQLVQAGTQLSIVCDRDCTMEGTDTLICGGNGQFDHQMPQCDC